MLSELILITSKQYNPIENMRLMNVTLLRRILSEKMKKDIKSLYISLIAAMLCGRIVCKIEKHNSAQLSA